MKKQIIAKELGPYISVTKAAEHTGLDRDFFYQAIHAKKIPFIITNRFAKRPTYKINLNGLQQYLAALEKRPS